MLLATQAGLRAQQQDTGAAARRVIIFVWDGLRADDLTPEITPNYFALARIRRRLRGPPRRLSDLHDDEFRLHRHRHLSGRARILRQRGVCAVRASGKNAKGADIDFSAPAFIEDFGVVEAVREAYQGKLTLVPTMLQAAQAKGLTTAAVGKFGAAFIQDYKRGGIILDEDAAMPLAFAKELQTGRLPASAQQRQCLSRRVR